MVLRCLRAVGRDFPNLFIPGEKTISYGELKSKNGYEEWERDEVNSVIEGWLRGDHASLIEKVAIEICNTQDISIIKKDQFYIEFIEVCQRRHLMIHNGGEVNDIYINKCLSAGVSKDKISPKGSRLDADNRYIKHSAACVYLVGLYIISMVAMKKYPEHKKIVFRILLSASHSFLEKKLTKMANSVIKFAEVNSRDFSNEQKLKFAINKALCKLLDEDLDYDTQTKEAKNIIINYDWSVSNPILELARSCVERDFEKLEQLAISAKKFGLDYKTVKTYVVFKEAVENHQILDIFAATKDI